MTQNKFSFSSWSCTSESNTDKREEEEEERRTGEKLKPGRLCLSSVRPSTHQLAALLCQQFLSFFLSFRYCWPVIAAGCCSQMRLVRDSKQCRVQRISTLANLHCPGATCTQSLKKKSSAHTHCACIARVCGENRCIVFHPGGDVGGFVG